MPFVWVRTEDQWKILRQVEKLVENLPSIVAKALSVPGTEGELLPNEIEVKVELFGEIREGKNSSGLTYVDLRDSAEVLKDIHTKNIEIIIWANDYPERAKNLDQRRKQIIKEVRKFIPPDITGFVWVLLQPGSYGEF